MSQKSDANALFGESDNFSTVSIPYPPISPHSVNDINDLDDPQSTDVELTDKEIKEFDKLASKISRKLLYGNNLL